MDVYDFLVLATVAGFFIYQIYRWVMAFQHRQANHEPIDKNATSNNDENTANAASTVDTLHTEQEVQLTTPKTAMTEIHSDADAQPETQTEIQSEIQSENELSTTLTANEVGTPANSSDYDSEDMDIGDMTIDVSEMLKELNLRESDSPRLDIDKTEYQQLKTGEPGEVKADTIEEVAGKLRNMLQ